MINLIDRVTLSIAMPTISKEFSLEPAVQGLVLSAFFWSYAVLQIPGGWLIDRFGPRALITGATVGWGVTAAGCIRTAAACCGLVRCASGSEGVLAIPGVVGSPAYSNM